ncbi:unnamed protein product [Eruca vesicaria subsp. sativa]|uniref:Uncharacterized protein n=1 Tax=Eruca vesicaria subsp. sativa TaxID=29727 RepID=A0ABC8JW60_ERUVS|nr:unnamed protein product [Eruca vesicaria subsp. sativa]
MDNQAHAFGDLDLTCNEDASIFDDKDGHEELVDHDGYDNLSVKLYTEMHLQKQLILVRVDQDMRASLIDRILVSERDAQNP